MTIIWSAAITNGSEGGTVHVIHGKEHTLLLLHLFNMTHKYQLKNSVTMEAWWLHSTAIGDLQPMYEYIS